MNLSLLRTIQKELIFLVYKNFEKSLLSHFIFFSYLGARICYAKTHPLALFFEEKFQNFEKFKDFLLNLKKAKHYSIFSHTPIFLNTQSLSEKEKSLLAQNFFKIFWDNENGYALFNLRHLAENLEDEEFKKLIDIAPDLSFINIKIFKNFQLFYEGSFSNLPTEIFKEDNSVWAIPEVIIIEIKINHPFNWIGVIAHNFSRIFSHQFVRHTWLNFNQRSHRYTYIEKFVVPSTFDEKCKDIYEKIIKLSLETYKDLSESIKKEDTRFIIPQGVATSILATAPLFVWEDFITKRAIPQAQEEIRKLACLLKENLF